jgi:hypothetical protein
VWFGSLVRVAANPFLLRGVCEGWGQILGENCWELSAVSYNPNRGKYRFLFLENILFENSLTLKKIERVYHKLL